MKVENERDLVEMVKTGATQREKALSIIYSEKQTKAKLTALILKNHGNVQDGEDFFQEAIIVLDRNIRRGDFRLDGSLYSYLLSIGKFLWMNHLRKKNLILPGEFIEADPPVSGVQPDHILIDAQRKEYLTAMLNKLGSKCQNILELWQLSYSMEEIANRLGMTDAAAARKAKYDCQQQLIKIIHANPNSKDELK